MASRSCNEIIIVWLHAFVPSLICIAFDCYTFIARFAILLDLRQSSFAADSLKKEQETLLDDKSRLENQCCDLEIKFSQSQSELDFLTRSSAEKFEMLEKSQKVSK